MTDREQIRRKPTYELVDSLLDKVERLSRVLLHVEGTLLAYWTDIPEAEIQQLLPLIRETLGDYEPGRPPPASERLGVSEPGSKKT